MNHFPTGVRPIVDVGTLPSLRAWRVKGMKPMMAVLAAGAAAALAIPNAVLPTEPTWAMMILGLGIVGSSMRRRKVDIAFA